MTGDGCTARRFNFAVSMRHTQSADGRHDYGRVQAMSKEFGAFINDGDIHQSAGTQMQTFESLPVCPERQLVIYPL